MKSERTIYTCDRCGREIPVTRGGYYIARDGKYSHVGVKAMYADWDSSQYDLCLKCTVEIVEQWLKEMKKYADKSKHVDACGKLEVIE